MDIKHCTLITNVEFDNLLILTHQNFRGLEHNSLKIAKVNQHDLCFTEHHMVKLKLCLISLENYSLGSTFSCSIYRKDDIGIFVIKDTCYIGFDLSIYCEEKNIRICAIQLTVQSIYIYIYIYICVYMCVCVCVCVCV